MIGWMTMPHIIIYIIPILPFHPYYIYYCWFHLIYVLYPHCIPIIISPLSNIFWANYSDLTVTSLESWLVRGIISTAEESRTFQASEIL